MKILLFGKNGQLGWELQRSLAPLGDLVALCRNSTDYCGDFSRPDDIARTVELVAPDVIVNAAAYTAVDKAEAEPDIAHTVNAQVPGLLARLAHDRKAWLVHYSTDYVFNGSGDTPWRENSPVAPINVYGRSKLEGEAVIQQSGCQHLIFRTSWVYAARGGNFAKTMLRLGKERDTLTVINDQFGAPTGADLLADVTAHALRSAMLDPQLAGLYHLAAGGETSWHGYASFVLEQARAAGVEIKTAANAILPVDSSGFPTAAQRPLNSRLDTRKLQEAFGLRLPDWQVGVARLLTEILDT
jgi:dTDP-4-dehydrorhamnose reductase